MKVTSTIAGVWQIIPDNDPPLQMRTGKSPGKATVVSIAAGRIGSAPAVKLRRKRLREKLIGFKQPSELRYLDRNWLDLLNVVVEGEIGKYEKKIVVQAHVVFDPNPPCTQCRSNACVTKWSIRSQPRNIKDTERNGKLVLIVLTIQRYFCDRCKKPFTPLLPFLADGHLSLTVRLSKRASELTLERHTTTAIAVLTGLSRRMVQDIARETAKTSPTPQEVFKTVTSKGKGHIIQIDNCHPSSGEGTSFLLDAKPFHMLDEYNEASIKEFLLTLDIKGRNNISCWVSDLAEFLLRLGRKFCPCATVVADPHHVVRLLEEGFDKFLKPIEDAMVAEYQTAIDNRQIVRPPRPKKKKLKKKSRLEPDISEAGNQEEEKKLRQPTAAEIRILLHTKIAKTSPVQRKALTFLLMRFPDARAAYYYIQRVMHLYHTSEIVVYGHDASGRWARKLRVVDAKEASKKFNQFEAKLPDHVREGLTTFLNTCRKNRDVICAFWPVGWTSGEIESQNGVIKGIDRAAHGLVCEELCRRWVHARSLSAVLGRDKERVLGKKEGPRKKSIDELSKLPPPMPVPVEGRGGQLSLF